jgi:hypothetical protein
MDMRLCPNNHYYDQSVHKECPYCNGGSGEAAGIGVTIPANPPGEIGKTAPAFQPGEIGKTAPIGVTAPVGGGTMPIGFQNAGGASKEGKTEIVDRDKIGLSPVVGWLVCIEGVDKGRDYRIHTGNNFIGRAPNMDIAIRNDNAVSSNKHAIISYDMRGRAYYFAQGDGVNIVYLNGKPVLSMVQLNAYDKIEIGRTTLLFVPLCGEEFNWVDLIN